MLGIYRITNDGVYLTRNEVMNIFMFIEKFNGKLPEPEILTQMEWASIVFNGTSKTS